MAQWYSHLVNVLSGIVDMFTGGAASDYILEDVTKKYNLSVQEANWLLQTAEQAFNQAGEDVSNAKQRLSDVLMARISSAPFSLRRAQLDDAVVQANRQVAEAQSVYNTAKEQVGAAQKKAMEIAANAPSKLATIDKILTGKE